MRKLAMMTATCATGLLAGITPAQAASIPTCVGISYSYRVNSDNYTGTFHFVPRMTGPRLAAPVSTVASYIVNNLPGSLDTTYNPGLGVDVSIPRVWQITSLRVSVQDARINFSNRYYVCPNKLRRVR